MDRASLKSRIEKRIVGIFPGLDLDEVLVESYGKDGGVRVSLLKKATEGRYKGRIKNIATAASRNPVRDVNGLVGNLVPQLRKI